MMTPDPPLHWRLYWDALKASLAQIAENDTTLVSAGVAFFAMLSLFPALAALIALLGLIADPFLVQSQMEGLRAFMPADVFDIVFAQVTSLVTASTDTLGWAGILSLCFALWSARAGVGAMMIGLNNVYQERKRTAARHYFKALMLTLMLVVVGIVAVLTLVIAPVVLAFFPLGPFGTAVAEAARWLIAIMVLFVGVGVLYRFGPNRKAARLPWLTAGAILAVGLWAVVSIGFSYYVANFGSYNRIYGSIGAVIAMLVWLWISSFLVLFGASLNAQIEMRTRRDSTVGRERPPGQRGAVAADTILSVDRGE